MTRRAFIKLLFFSGGCSWLRAEGRGQRLWDRRTVGSRGCGRRPLVGGACVVAAASAAAARAFICAITSSFVRLALSSGLPPCSALLLCSARGLPHLHMPYCTPGAMSTS
eukprot:scaffold18381_cov79-Phaeocystis_antarctica.AAC.9